MVCRDGEEMKSVVVVVVRSNWKVVIAGLILLSSCPFLLSIIILLHSVESSSLPFTYLLSSLLFPLFSFLSSLLSSLSSLLSSPVLI